MALILDRTTNSHQLLKMVGVADDAIDWEASYPDEEPGRKRARYIESHDIRELVFKPDGAPTVFVFEHPHRFDVDRKVRRSWTELLKPGARNDLWVDVWNQLYLGKEEGLVDVAREEPPRQGGELTTAFFQALHDAGVFSELAQAVIDIGKTSATKRLEGDTAKKKSSPGSSCASPTSGDSPTPA